MRYIFDTNAFSQLFRSYYRRRFPTLWRHFDSLVCAGSVTSTREVKREIEDSSIAELTTWATQHQHLFPSPTLAEAEFVGHIFRKSHFRQVIEKRKLLKGGRNADPFVIARAYVLHGAVITMERGQPNGARIPNICRHFRIDCLSLEEFMEREGWQF